MENDQPLLKKLANISVIAVGVLFVLGVIFYKERVYFADASYVLFNIINTGHFDIQWARYGSFIVQLFPYLGQKMNLPLGTLAFLYGISFNFFYLVAISLLVYCFKQYRLAILLALFYLLPTSESFIWISEIPQGVTWLFLCYGLTIYLGRKNVNIMLILVPFIALAYLAIATHFVILIPTVFLWGYFIMEKDFLPFSRNKIILLSGVLVAIIVAKFAIAMNGPKDTGEGPLLQGVLHPTIKSLYYSLKTPVVKMFAFRSVINYWATPLLFTIGILSLTRKKRYLPALWAAATCTGYILIMGLTYGKFDRNVALFHIESEWVCFAIIAATPFVFSFLPGNTNKIALCLLAGVFVARIAYIGAFLPRFSERVHLREQVMTQMKTKGITKLALYNDEKLAKTLILDWGLPFETLMNSTVSGDKPQIIATIVNKDDKKRMEALSASRGIVLSWMKVEPDQLNSRYFAVDTTTYRFMTLEDLVK